MGACKNYSRWGLIWAASLFAVSSSGCGYALRPVNWLVHNTIPSACKTCPGGLPGPGGCRSFENPWCAGYQTTLWQHLGKDCGPARLPTALVGLEDEPSQGGGSAPSESSQNDAAPALPDAFPNPLPEPGNLPPALPDLPPSETDLPPSEDFPFPVRPVPSSPDDSSPENPLRDPSDSGAPTVSPDLFPESRPSAPSGEKKPAPAVEKTPPLVVPEKIDDLFNTPEKSDPDDSSPTSESLPDDFPSFENGPSPKQPEALPEPERKVPSDNAEPDPADSLPPMREPNRIPALPPLKSPEKKSDTPEKEDSEIPKLFEDSSIQQYPEPSAEWENNSTLRFGRVIQTSVGEEPILRVQPAGGTVENDGGFYGPGSGFSGPPQPLLRIKQ